MPIIGRIYFTDEAAIKEGKTTFPITRHPLWGKGAGAGGRINPFYSSLQHFLISY